MKNKLQLVGIASSIILLIFSMFFLIRAGYATDEYGLSGSYGGIYDYYGYTLWAILLVGALMLIIFLRNLSAKFVKLVLIGGSLLITLLIIVLEPNYKDMPSPLADSESYNILEVSWEEAEALIEEGFSSFLYVGRDNCPVCAEFKPKLSKLAVEADITIYYYNTIEDRENIPEEFQKRMEYLCIETVPAVLIVGNSEFEKLDSGDSLLDEVKKNLSNIEK